MIRGKISALTTGLRFYPRIRYLRYYRRILESTGKPPDIERSKKEAEKLRDAFIKSGPIFIKLGQMLSSRRDVVPEEYLEILSELQDKVPMPDFSKVKEEIESEIGNIKDVFEYFDESGISGASLGLVYKAKYKGKDVAVKVNRPHIKEIISKDKIRVAEFVHLLERNTERSFALAPFVDEFLSSLERELDYEREAESIDIISKKIAEMNIGINIKVPEVYREISTKKVLVMEYLDFIKITDISELTKNNVNVKEVAKIIDKLFIRLALREGRFHADPHPGNIGVMRDGRIALMDFGMTSELPEDMRDNLVMAYYYLAKLDARNLLRTLVEMGIVDPLADRTVMEEGIAMVLKDFEGKEIDRMEFQELMNRANTVLIRFPFRLPYNLALFVRMSVILEGLCKTLDRDFNFVSVVMEIMEEEHSSWEVLKKRITKIPAKISKTIRDFLDVPELLRNLNRKNVQKENSNISKPIIASGFLIAGAILINKPVFAGVMFVIGFIFIILSFTK